MTADTTSVTQLPFRHVFVLCSGRCGSLTTSKALGHATNYTTGHESRWLEWQNTMRLNYPAQHIEVDNRLGWITGLLQQKFGDRDDVCYIHLRPSRKDVAKSFAHRCKPGPMGLLENFGIIFSRPPRQMTIPQRTEVALGMIDAVTANIDLFLRDKPHKADMRIATARDQFPGIWKMLGCQGSLKNALNEFNTRHNASWYHRT